MTRIWRKQQDEPSRSREYGGDMGNLFDVLGVKHSHHIAAASLLEEGLLVLQDLLQEKYIKITLAKFATKSI